MSASNAAAIRRRVNNQATPPPPVANNQSTLQSKNGVPQSKNVSLPQFINSLDQRIKVLEETFSNSNNETKELDSKIIDEYNTRFEILASEIGELKDVILKLQSFTMEVNKSLYDDRIHIMTDNVKESETDNTLIHQIQENQTDFINQENNKDKTTSVDLKSMVEEELTSSNDV